MRPDKAAPTHASRGARARAGLGVLAWTAPLALLLMVPGALSESGTEHAVQAPPAASEGPEGDFETPAPSLDTHASMMMARPLAFLSHQREFSYPMDQVWPTAIRYLKLDRKYKVTDKDLDAGYIMFEFPQGPTGTGAGSLELLATTDPAGRAAVRVMISTSNGPAHLPHTIGEGLHAKIKSERGQPAPPPPSTPPEGGDKPKGEGEPKNPDDPDDESWILHPNGDR